MYSNENIFIFFLTTAIEYGGMGMHSGEFITPEVGEQLTKLLLYSVPGVELTDTFDIVKFCQGLSAMDKFYKDHITPKCFNQFIFKDLISNNIKSGKYILMGLLTEDVFKYQLGYNFANFDIQMKNTFRKPYDHDNFTTSLVNEVNLGFKNCPMVRELEFSDKAVEMCNDLVETGLFHYLNYKPNIDNKFDIQDITNKLRTKIELGDEFWTILQNNMAFVTGGIMSQVYNDNYNGDIDIVCDYSNVRQLMTDLEKQYRVESTMGVYGLTKMKVMHNNKIYNMDIISKNHYSVDHIIRTFHFGCVKAAYDGKVFKFFPSYMLAMKTNICVAYSHIMFSNIKFKTVEQKYIKRGYTLLVPKLN